jgi:hypothetical protein
VVSGPAEERQRLVRLWTGGEWVFNRILPQPDPFTDEDVARLRIGVGQMYPGGESLLDQVFDNAWWWRNINWGTTSDVGGRDNPADVQERGDETIIDFITDSCPPIPVMEATSRLYPSLVLNLKYFEAGCRLAGEGTFVAGNGQGTCYEPDSPECRRLAAELG